MTGHSLMKFPAFAEALKKCDNILRPHGIFIMDILKSEDKSIFDNVINLLVGLAGLQVRKS